MCHTIYLPQDEGASIPIRKIGELRRALGVEPVIAGGYAELPPECCLCPIDTEATAALAGMKAVNYDHNGDCDFVANDALSRADVNPQPNKNSDSASA